MANLTLIDQGGSSPAILCCPNCGFQYLHQGRVEVFHRGGEDSKEGIHVVVDGRTVATNTSMAGNPSGRRNGVKIYLSCENCPAGSVLTIAQHKGQTYVEISVPS